MKKLFILVQLTLMVNTVFGQNVDSLINAEVENAKKNGIIKKEYYKYENQLREMLRKKSNEYDYVTFESYIKKFFSKDNNNNNKEHSTYKGDDGFTWEATCYDMKAKSVSNKVAFYNDDIEIHLSFRERMIYAYFYNNSATKIIVPWDKAIISSTLTRKEYNKANKNDNQVVVYGNDFSICYFTPFERFVSFYNKKAKTVSFYINISYISGDVKKTASIDVVGNK